MKSVYEYLTESPMAVIDDWEGTKIKLEHISLRVLDRNWDKMQASTEANVEVYISKDKSSAIIGAPSESVEGYFSVVAELRFRYRKDSFYIHPNTYAINGVKTAFKDQGRGYASTLYRTLLDSGMVIMSDHTQFDGARALYQKLNDSNDYAFDLWDEYDKKFIAKDVKLKHDKESWDLDYDVWSWDNSKMNTKILMRKRTNDTSSTDTTKE